MGALCFAALGCAGAADSEHEGEASLSESLSKAEAVADACVPNCQTADCSNELPHPGVLDGDAPIVHDLSVGLTAGVPYTFETSALNRPEADPVLHLLDGTGTEVAVADGGGSGNNARLSFTPAASALFTLVLRAKDNTSFGQATLSMNGSLLASNWSFGGWQVRVSCWRKLESLETVRPPRGAGEHQAMYVLKPDGLGIERYSFTGGTAGGVKIQPQSALGTRNVIVAARDGLSLGAIRLVRNDLGVSHHDGDFDGLGIELEAAIGTCASRWSTNVPGFDCQSVADARDTDGDGISDGWELLGRKDMLPHQPLPKWGSDPRHKDLFLEVDFMQRCSTTEDLLAEPSTVRKLASYYGDRIELLSPERMAAHAASLNNPDGQPGISVHVDSGQDPPWASPEDATIYGNWGGHNPVPPVSPPPPDCGNAGQSAGVAWVSNMVEARRGIFHYGLGYVGGGGASAEFKFYSSWAQDSSLNMAHELGHSLGLGHSGNAQASSIDPNCKPNYPSIMSYAYYDHSWEAQAGFSDGLTRPDLNNSSLLELGAVPPSDTRYLDHLSWVFKYNVDRATGSVDWNRDGQFSSTPVRAYANFAPGGAGCEWTRYNTVTSQVQSVLAPSLARLRGETYIWAARASDGKLLRSGTSSAMNCPEPAVGTCNGAAFGAPVVYDYDATRGVDTTNLDYAGSKRLLLVRVDAQGNLWGHQVSQGPGGVNVLGSPTLIPSSGSEGEPALAAVSGSEAFLAYRGTAGKVWFRRFVNSAWGPEIPAHVANPDGSVVPLPPFSDSASPELAFVPIPSAGFGDTRQLYGAFSNGSGGVRLYRFNPAVFLWTVVDIFESTPVVRSKPTMVWVPTTTGVDVPGRLYFYYLDSARNPRMQITYASQVGAAQKLGLDSPLDNSWTLARGLSAMYEPGVDSNVKLAASGNDTVVTVRPNADGITNYALRNNDDWAAFGATLCNTVVRPDLSATPFTSIFCPEISWL
jgi:hypothetical protein